ncbi:MAG: (2Fe-2S) ferredoxin domain-containing protein [Candidatus Hydrogenedens sp.]
MIKQPVPYKRIIFVCTNKKEDLSKPCCAAKKGEEIATKLKQIVRERNLKDQIRVSKSGCMGKCEHGPNLMVYPEGIWYSNIKEEDLQFLFDELLKPLL